MNTAAALNKKQGLYIKTFGCAMNEYDSERIVNLLSDEYKLVLSPEEADLIIINTCSVRAKAESKLYSILGIFRKLKQNKPELLIGVCGCVAQQEGQAIFKKNQSVDFVVGTHNISRIPEILLKVKSGFTKQYAVELFSQWDIDRDDNHEQFKQRVPFDNEASVRALVAISRGCNESCSFCVVPKTRGQQISRCSEEILAEIKAKVSKGAKEVLLLGQTVNSYGTDLDGKVSFSDLIRKVSKIEGVERIRFISPHPLFVDEDFLALFNTVPNLCPHIHLPLQSGSDRILKLMNRAYTSDKYLEIINKLRKVCPNIAFTSDIIVGFPTETQGDFEDTLRIMSIVGFHSSYSFCYSVRPNTDAKQLFGDKDSVSEDIASQRLSILQKHQDDITEKINAKYLNTVVKVLVEKVNLNISSSLRGRTNDNVLTEVQIGSPFSLDAFSAGDIISVSITQTSNRGLKGIPVL